MKRIMVLGLALALASAATPVRAADYTYDVVVYGGTSGGVTAAVQAARMGKSVALIDPGCYVGGTVPYVSHLGGLSSGGLGATDVGDSSAIGGLSYDFYRRVKGWDFGSDGNYNIEAYKAEAVYDAMVAEAGVDVFRNERLDRGSGGVAKSGATITSIATLAGSTFHAGAFIDGTYEGDLLAAAGGSYTVGREARSQYGEHYNGLAYDETREHVFGNDDVNPYVTPGDPGDGLLPGVHEPAPVGTSGEADHRIQAYCYRMTWTKDADRAKWTDLWGTNGQNPPAGYDRATYELHHRFIEAGNDLGDVVRLDTGIPGGKNDINNWGPASTNFIGGNYDVYVPATDRTTNYAEATYEEREYIIQKHIEYTKGFLYYLAFDAPSNVRAQMGDWGLASDEFTDNGNFPHQLYVREARRMIGEYVMTEDNCTLDTTAPHPIGLGAYPMDSHNTHRYIDTDGYVEAEGNFWLGSLRETYSIDYGSITPLEAEIDNLAVVAALSASHTAFGSMRMEPVYMVLGQSAGTAAVRALEEGVSVQQIDFPTYQALMRQWGQVLTTSEPAAGPFVGTMWEDFNYGPDKKDLETVSYVAPGWAEPWDSNHDDPHYDPAAQMAYAAPGYVNSAPWEFSGGAADATGARSGHITLRPIAGDGMAGEVWLSALVALHAATGEEAMLWLDGGALGLGVAEGGVLELFGNTVGSGLADGAVHLLLAKMLVDAGSDSVDLWIDPDLSGGEAGLLPADLSAGGSDLFGNWLNSVGFSVGDAGGMIDALRVSNEADGFEAVTMPEPGALALLLAGGAGLWMRRKSRKRKGLSF